jgi:cytochrome c-type biogenesis protein
VIDPIGSAITAAALQSPWAPPLAFAAGVATSVGPCVAPRFVAVAALASSSGVTRWKVIAAFAAGLCASYVALGVASGFAGRIAAISDHVYALLALVLLAFGLKTLWSEPPQSCSHVDPKPRSLGGACLLGMSFALVASPCCAPVIVVLGSLAASGPSAAFGAALIGSYAIGHALPLAGAGFGWQWIGTRLDVRTLGTAMQTVGGALMIALAGYYGALA